MGVLLLFINFPILYFSRADYAAIWMVKERISGTAQTRTPFFCCLTLKNSLLTTNGKKPDKLHVDIKKLGKIDGVVHLILGHKKRKRSVKDTMINSVKRNSFIL